MERLPGFSCPDKAPELHETIQLAHPKPAEGFQIASTDGLYTVEALALRSASEQRRIREILKLPPLKNGPYLPSQDNHGE